MRSRRVVLQVVVMFLLSVCSLWATQVEDTLFVGHKIFFSADMQGENICDVMSVNLTILKGDFTKNGSTVRQTKVWTRYTLSQCSGNTVFVNRWDIVPNESALGFNSGTVITSANLLDIAKAFNFGYNLQFVMKPEVKIIKSMEMDDGLLIKSSERRSDATATGTVTNNGEKFSIDFVYISTVSWVRECIVTSS